MQQSQAKSLFFFQSGLDNELLYELYESDYESTLQAFQIFLDELESNINDLGQAHQQQNISAFQKIIHRCKPVFSYVGLSELNNIFQQIEDQCNTLTSIDQLTPSFNDIVSLIRASSPKIITEKARLEEFVKKG
jgi:HPt (histidine-containing phosphotransfer) domain-containing protein